MEARRNHKYFLQVPSMLLWLGVWFGFLGESCLFSCCSEIGSLTGLELTEQAGPLASESQRSSGLGIGIKSMHHSTGFFPVCVLG